MKRSRSLVGGLIAIAGVLCCLETAAQPPPPPTEQSLVLFEELLRNPDNVKANLTYAKALEAEGQTEEARRIYEKVPAS